jgi:hypothetical protein
MPTLSVEELKSLKNWAMMAEKAEGYAVFVGGKMGKSPRLADRLPATIESESQF